MRTNIGADYIRQRSKNAADFLKIEGLQHQMSQTKTTNKEVDNKNKIKPSVFRDLMGGFFNSKKK